MDRETPPEPETVRPVVRKLAKEARAGKLDRREFMTLASVFGVSAAGAHALLGIAPAAAQEAEPQSGGTLRVAMRVLEIGDPRIYDWPEMGNVARQFCETLARWNADFTITPLLLESWEVSDDAQLYTLNVRPGVTWNNGDAFTAEDVAFNIRRWCDTEVEGNSMATAMATLVDASTGQLAEGVVEVLDPMTLRLTLPSPDISIIPSMTDYPALIVHPGIDAAGGLAEAPVGTGPFELEEFAIGFGAQLRRRESGWWGGTALLDGIRFTDYGTDPSPIIAAFESGEIHVNDESPAAYLEILDSIDLVRKEQVTPQTIVVRMNVGAPPYDDVAVRRAIQLAVDNQTVLDLALQGLGLVGENHHVGPMHPEYAELPAPVADPAAAFAALEAAGHAETEFEIISIEGDWQSLTADAVAGQLRAAGLNVTRAVLPGGTFWNGWTSYPFSATDWGGRPLGVQALSLAYRSGAPWNETGFNDPEFDAKLDEALGIFDADARRDVMADIETILQESGIIIQPFWRNMYLHHVPAVMNYERHPSREMHFERVWLDQTA